MAKDPDWLAKMRAEGAVQETGVNPASFLAAPGHTSNLPDDLKVSEKKFQRDVIDFAHMLGWTVAHFRPVRVLSADGRTHWETPVDADGKGFLDLELVRDRLIKVELKVGKNTMEAEQKNWFNLYARIGVEVYCWYPRDWPTIREVLK